MATQFDELYESDFYVWTQRQAEALRRLAATRPNLDVDFRHLIEEVADWGTSQRDAVRGHLRRVIEPCLKLEHSVARDPRGADCPYSLDDLLSDGWYPANRRGLPDDR